MSKNALFCVAIYPEEKSIPIEFKNAFTTFEKYCKKYNLDLIVIRDKKYNFQGDYNYNYVNLEKYQAYDAFREYDRLLKIDLDILITVNCPNLFDVVPEDSVGVLFEDIGKRKTDRIKQMQLLKKNLGDIPAWISGYFNSGVVVMSKQHQDANYLNKEDIEALLHKDIGLLREQNMLNWKVRKLGYKIFPFDYKYNHMFMFDEVNWDNIKRGSLLADNTKNSYILHYAGLKGKIRNGRMCRDYNKIIRDWDNQGY